MNAEIRRSEEKIWGRKIPSILLSAPICVDLRPKFLSLRLCVSAVIFLIAALTITAQIRTGQGWVWQNPSPQGNPLYAIHFAADKEIGYAVGSDNTVLRTIDGGFRWVRQDIPFSDVTFSSVFVKDKNVVFVVGARGTIYTTENGGKDWRRVATDVKDHFSSIKFTGAELKTGWITGTYGCILKTIDGGLTWKPQISGTSENLLNIDLRDESRAVAVGQSGVTLATSDGGETWKTSDPCSGSIVTDAAYICDRIYISAGYGG